MDRYLISNRKKLKRTELPWPVAFNIDSRNKNSLWNSLLFFNIDYISLIGINNKQNKLYEFKLNIQTETHELSIKKSQITTKLNSTIQYTYKLICITAMFFENNDKDFLKWDTVWLKTYCFLKLCSNAKILPVGERHLFFQY